MRENPVGGARRTGEATGSSRDLRCRRLFQGPEGRDMRNDGKSERCRNDGSMEEEGFKLLLRLLHRELGLDVFQYKPGYLRRRIGVRMRATGCRDYLQYRNHLRRNPREAEFLVKDLTINVTEFFRDPDVFEALRERVIPEILQCKQGGYSQSVRVWSAGCATGEEPYSVAILFLEKMEELGLDPARLRITATDLDPGALQKAKAGEYGEIKLLPGIEEEKYFTRSGDRRVVREEVKKCIRYMLLDVMKPPPLRHLDLILCRNVLIYFEKEQQVEILKIFNRCLRKGGFLVLGKSEAILGTGESGFESCVRTARIYRKIGPADGLRVRGRPGLPERGKGTAK